MKILYEAPETAEELCPSVQCAFCDLWTCGCQVNVPCTDHFSTPCAFEREER